MTTHDDKNPPPAPRIDPARLRSAEVMRIIDEWINKYYVPEEDYIDDVSIGNRPLIRDDESSTSLSTWSVLERAFGGTLDAGNLAAISELMSYKSPRWVRRGTAGPSSNDSSSPSPDDLDRTHGRSPEEIIGAAHLKMLAALRELEKALDDVTPFSPNMGGNNPPEYIGVPPYTDEDERNVHAAILTLRNSPAMPVPIPSDVGDAVEAIDRTAIKFAEYVGALGDISARKFAEEMGKTAAKAVVGIGVWALLGSKLMLVAQTAYQWLEAIRLFG